MKQTYLVPYWNDNTPKRYWKTIAVSAAQAENNVRWKLRGQNACHCCNWHIGKAFIPYGKKGEEFTQKILTSFIKEHDDKIDEIVGELRNVGYAEDHDDYEYHVHSLIGYVIDMVYSLKINKEDD